jgi:hypothetical protein
MSDGALASDKPERELRRFVRNCGVLQRRGYRQIRIAAKYFSDQSLWVRKISQVRSMRKVRLCPDFGGSLGDLCGPCVFGV